MNTDGKVITQQRTDLGNISYMPDPAIDCIKPLNEQETKQWYKEIKLLKYELMIGDWVQDSRDGKRTQVNASAIHAMANNTSPYFDEEYIEPIPLTEEILTANAFTWRLGLWYTGEHDALGQEFIINTRCEGHPFIHECHGDIIWHFKYVHELQHGLRLVGLTELADNFNVE